MEQNTLSYLDSHENPDLADRAAAILTSARSESPDPEAIAEIDRFAEVLGSALTPVVWLLSPTAIVLGGYLQGFADLLIDRLGEVLRSETLDSPALLISTLGHEAPLLGALESARARAHSDLLGGRLRSTD